VTSRSQGLIRVLYAIGLLTIAVNRAQAQQRGVHGPRWGFASAGSADVRHPRLIRTWNPSDDLDTVWIVMGRSHTAPVDSIRISVRSGPPRSTSGGDPIAATYLSDSLGQWVTAPRTLLHPGKGERNVPIPMRVLAVFSPSEIASWARSQNPNRPIVTRVAADVWRRKTYEHAELYIDARAVDPKAIVAPQRKPNPVTPVRK
jgi:hypothetical protein